MPEYELTVSDGARIKTLFRENAWAKELTASNLYRGAMVRLGPVMYAVAQDKRDGWKGRLIGPVRGGNWPLPAILLGVHNGLRYIYDRPDRLRARRSMRQRTRS